MTTLVGTQSNFDDAIYSLVELEYDAIGAYELALERLNTTEYKSKLSSFIQDHKQHVNSLKGYYGNSSVSLPESADMVKGMMAKMKVLFGDFTGSDENILRAMLSNEQDTNTAYNRLVNHPAKPRELDPILEKAFLDEQNHKIWLEQTIGN